MAHPANDLHPQVGAIPRVVRHVSRVAFVKRAVEDVIRSAGIEIEPLIRVVRGIIRVDHATQGERPTEAGVGAAIRHGLRDKAVAHRPIHEIPGLGVVRQRQAIAQGAAHRILLPDGEREGDIAVEERDVVDALELIELLGREPALQIRVLLRAQGKRAKNRQAENGKKARSDHGRCPFSRTAKNSIRSGSTIITTSPAAKSSGGAGLPSKGSIVASSASKEPS